MKILKTALLSSALMGAIFGSNEALLNPDEIAIEKKADSEYFAETLKKLEEENNKNLEIIKKIAAKAVGGKNIEVDAKKGPALTYLGALYTRIISLLEANKELVAEHNTQKAQLDEANKTIDDLRKQINPVKPGKLSAEAQKLQDKLNEPDSDDDESSQPESENKNGAGSRFSASAGLKGVLNPFANLIPAPKPPVNASPAALTTSNIDRVIVVDAKERSAAWQAEQEAIASTAADALPTAAEVTLTPEEIVHRQKIAKWISVVRNGEPIIHELPKEPNVLDNKLNEESKRQHGQYAFAKGMLEANGLIVSVKTNNEKLVSELLITVQSPKPVWEEKNKKNSKVDAAKVRYKLELEAYDAAFPKLLELTTEKCEVPARPTPKKNSSE